MIIDIAALVIAGWGFFTGYRRGLLHSIFFLLGLVGGAIAALHFSAEMSIWLSDNVDIPPKYLPIVSFGLIFALVVGGVVMISNGIESILKALSLNIFNKLAGALVWTAIAVFLFSTVLWFLVQYEILKTDQLEASVAYPLLADISPLVVSAISAIAPYVEEVFEKMQVLIEENQWAPDNVESGI